MSAATRRLSDTKGLFFAKPARESAVGRTRPTFMNLLIEFALLRLCNANGVI